MRTRVVLVGVVLSLVAVACGGGGDADNGVASIDDTQPTIVPSGDAGVDTEAQLLRFAECMRSQGIDLPDPTVDVDGNVQVEPPADFELADLEEIFDAAENCEEFLEGISLGFDDIDLASATDVLLEFAQCMRDNGFDLPDPDFSFAVSGDSVPPAGPFGDVDLNDPDFVDAFGNCQDILIDLGTAGN